MNGRSLDDNVLDFFVYNEIFDEPNGMTARGGKRNEYSGVKNLDVKREQGKNFNAEGERNPTIPLKRILKPL